MKVFVCNDSNNDNKLYVVVGESQEALWNEIKEQVCDSMEVELPDSDISNVLQALAETAELEAIAKAAFHLGINAEQKRLRDLLSI